MKKIRLICMALVLVIGIAAIAAKVLNKQPTKPDAEFTGDAFKTLEDNVPSFDASDITTEAYETYTKLDKYGRCGVAVACCGPELMPKDGEERESISHVKPSGWVQNAYDFIDGEYVYNRCHLIGWQLTAENANEKNLITGTRYMNTEGMLPFENMVADYIRETDNHVMYRVTPHYEGKNLVCSGVELEAYSVEDDGEGISFHVYCFNVQPGVAIDYATGANWKSDDEASSAAPTTTGSAQEEYVLNTKSKRIHKPDCGSVNTIAAHNRKQHQGAIDELLDEGYQTCGSCFK